MHGSGAATMPERVRNSFRRSASSGRFVTTTPSSTSSWPPRYFVALWSTKSAPCSIGRRWIGVAAVESTTTRAGCAAAASRSGIVRNGFDGASSQTRSTPSGGAPVWSNSTYTQAPTFELVEQHAGPEVRALGERDRVARGEEGEDERSRSAAARCEQQSVPAVELAELPLRLDAGGVAVALVDELAGLPVLVRPEGGAVDHELTLAVAFCRRFARPWLLPPMLR